MSELYVCPKINKLDPASKKFDGGGHLVSTHPVGCSDHEHDSKTVRCKLQLEPASDAWRRFYGLPEADEASA